MSLKNIKFKVTNLPLALTKHPTSLEMTVHTKKKSRLSLIVRVNVVLNRTVAVLVSSRHQEECVRSLSVLED